MLKTLLKRFGVRQIVVSDRGVKEGYLQLILEGKECGCCYDFEDGKIIGDTRKNENTQKKSVKKKSDRSDKKKNSADSEVKKPNAKNEKKEQPPAGETAVPSKRRGRPKKSEEAMSAVPTETV